MPKVELVYFSGCPSVENARRAILAAGVTSFSEIDLDDLAEGHPYRNLSSPSVLLDGEVVVGSSNNGAACSLISWNDIIQVISARMANGRSGK